METKNQNKKREALDVAWSELTDEDKLETLKWASKNQNLEKEEVVQLHKGLGSGRVELGEVQNVEMGYTIRVYSSNGIETQRFLVGDPEGDAEREEAEKLLEDEK